jgi:hypothetical protein
MIHQRSGIHEYFHVSVARDNRTWLGPRKRRDVIWQREFGIRYLDRDFKQIRFFVLGLMINSNQDLESLSSKARFQISQTLCLILVIEFLVMIDYICEIALVAPNFQE